jgi:fructokinase
MSDILTIGEAVIELISTDTGVTLREAPVFEKTVGGTPINVAVGLARLGAFSGYIGRVGDDPFGHFLADTLAAEGVDLSQLGFERKARTGLAFTSLSSEGERNLLFFRHPSADMRLSPGHVNPGYIKNARALVYTSIGLMAEPCRSGVLNALAIADGADVLRVYDVNLHLSSWGSVSEARYGLGLGLDRADVVKLSLDELEFLSDTRDPSAGVKALWDDRKRLVIVTLGIQGCNYYTAGHSGQIPGYHVDTVDTAGAGDGFLAGLLAELLAVALSFEPQAVERALCFAMRLAR